MQEETEVLGENLRGQVWIENQIHIRLWPDWESNPGRIGERHGNNRCANPPTSEYKCPPPGDFPSPNLLLMLHVLAEELC